MKREADKVIWIFSKDNIIIMAPLNMLFVYERKSQKCVLKGCILLICQESAHMYGIDYLYDISKALYYS
jgi:hypothetical protein